MEGNTITHYLYGHSGQLLSEVKYTTTASDPAKATGTQLQQSKVPSYIYATGHQLAKVDGSFASGMKYYYHNDNLGSTMLMTKKADPASTDPSKQNPIVFMQDYTPFGQNLHQPGEPAATNETEATLKFTGQVEDADIGLCYYNARYYDPEIGRFTQEDTHAGSLENPLTQNLYIYALDNPLKFIDPTGHDVVDNNSDWTPIDSWEGMYSDDYQQIYRNGKGQILVSQKAYTDTREIIMNSYFTKDGKLDHLDIKCFELPNTNTSGFHLGGKGNVMIEPVGGSTISFGKGGVDTHTTYPNGSNYQRLNPNGHLENSTPHGHGHLEGNGPSKRGQGLSIDVNGNVVNYKSPDAHWNIYR